MAHHGNGHGYHNDSHELGHVVPFKVYLGVFIALLVLTVITVFEKSITI